MWNTPSKTRLATIPALYATDDIPAQNKEIHLHFFLGGCDWYVAEFDGTDLFWGFVILAGDYQSAEWGYFSFKELRSVSAYGGMEIDCELEEIWRIKPAGKIDKICHASGWKYCAAEKAA